MSNKKKNSKKTLKKNILPKIINICTVVLPFLLTIAYVILSIIDNSCPDDELGVLSDGCAIIDYYIWMYISLALTIVCFLSALLKQPIFSIIGSIIIIVFDIFILIITTKLDTYLKVIPLSIIVTFIVLMLEADLSERKKEY